MYGCVGIGKYIDLFTSALRYSPLLYAIHLCSTLFYPVLSSIHCLNPQSILHYVYIVGARGRWREREGGGESEREGGESEREGGESKREGGE